MRILAVSNAMHVPTGYGQQMRTFVPRIKDAGHEITLFAFFGQEGGPSINSQGITTLPRLTDPYGCDVIDSHYKYVRADVLLTLIDIFVYQPIKAKLKAMNTVSWCPIDSEPMLPAIAQTLHNVKRVWAMSRHGEKMLHNAGFTNVDYVPHGINHHEFHPLPDKGEVLARLKTSTGIDLADKFVVTMNSANKGVPSRKGFFEAFASFKVFSDTHPDAVLMVHSEMLGIHQGEQLPVVAEMVGLDRSKIIYSPQYHYVSGMLPPSFLNDIYNVSDVYLHTSHGEGFGIPIVEAQTCGVPVIVTDFSAMAELCFAGWKVPGMPFMPAPGMLHRIPLIPKVVEALEASYQQRGYETTRRQAIHGAADYDADVVFERHMKPALAKIEAMVAEDAKKQAEIDRLKAIAETAVAKNGNGHVAGTITPPTNGYKKGKKGKKKVRA